MSISLTPASARHFLIHADEPVVVEVSATEDGWLLAHVYRRGEYEPVGAFDSSIDNKEWTA